MVWHLDRFGSSLKDLDSKIKSLEERRGPRLFDRGHRHHKPEKLTFNIFGALAEFEREVAREQLMAELEASRERRRVGGDGEYCGQHADASEAEVSSFRPESDR